jgi:hypothetical protein
LTGDSGKEVSDAALEGGYDDGSNGSVFINTG